MGLILSVTIVPKSPGVVPNLISVFSTTGAFEPDAEDAAGAELPPCPQAAKAKAMAPASVSLLNVVMVYLPI